MAAMGAFRPSAGDWNPDKFQFGTCLGKHYEQVGNAVPVPIARAIAQAVAEHLRPADTE